MKILCPTTEKIIALTDGATVTLLCDRGDIFKVTLGGNRTLALSGDVDEQRWMLILIQDGTGSRTVTWWSGITTWHGTAGPTTAPVLSTAAGKRDYVSVIRHASGDYDAFFSKGS